MTKHAFEKWTEITETTRNLSLMNLELAEEGRAAVRTTREMVERSRETLRAGEAELDVPGYLGSTDDSTETRSYANRAAPLRVIVVGGSAGSHTPLHRIVSELPKEFPAAVLIVLHSVPSIWAAQSVAELLGQSTTMSVSIAADLQPIESGHIYVCPPNHHLSLENGLMRVDKSPSENFTRPSIDVLFRSAAANFGRGVVAVLLSGTFSDGTAGLWQIKRRGGVAVVQEPDEAEFPYMPKRVIEKVIVDYILPADQIGSTLVQLVSNAQQASSDSERKPSIMIVEDEVLGAENLSERLRELAYEVCGTVTSGEEAVSLAEEMSPDLVLMDIRLAGKMDGIEAARQIWESLQIPVVFVTAYADLRTLASVKNTRNYGYLVKPFHILSIQAVVELALDRRRKELGLSI